MKLYECLLWHAGNVMTESEAHETSSAPYREVSGTEGAFSEGSKSEEWGMQVCAEVAIVILDENTPASRSWFTWRDILHLVDIICCCAILFPIVWSIKHLREAAGVRALTHLQRVISSSSGHLSSDVSLQCVLCTFL